MDLGYANRVAVVTGGSSGIGLETARLLLAEGARVAVCGRDPGRLETARGQLEQVAGPEAVLAHPCDVLKADDVARFASAVADWGGGRLDLLVNNAGQGRVSTFTETSDEAWREELELKFFSQILSIRAFRPLLDAAETSAIVAVNSLLALQPEPHMVCTSAARAGVQNLLKSLATEFAPRIRVNSILIGLVDSAQWRRRFERRSNTALTREEWYGGVAAKKGIPLGRLGRPEEPARAIVFLGSPAASYITGASLEVSGGVSRSI